MQVLVQIDAWDSVLGGEVSLLAASHDDPRVCHASGNTWWPAIAKLPVLRYDLFDGAFGDAITTPSSSLVLQTEAWPDFPRYSFPDARLRLWTGDVDDPANVWTLRFDGRVTAQPQIEGGTAAIEFAADDRWLDTALLATYAGTTGAEGPLGMKGQAKPLALGAPRYVPGKLIDSVNNVFQVSSYGAVQEFEAALERLVRFGAPIADYATYAALVAATIPAGAWATAKAVGMARFGAPTTGQVSFLIKGDVAGADGWARKPGQLVRRIAQLSGGTGKIDDASLNALDLARPYNLSLYVDDQTTARELIQQIAASVNAVAAVSWTGKLFLAPIALAAPTLTLAADGSALPPVASVKQIDVASPWQKLALGAERAWAVHALSDIAFTAPLLPMGRYSSTTIYREGNIVDLIDGSHWLYTAPTPSAGNAPVAGSGFWLSLTGATQVEVGSGPGSPGNLVDSDGNPITAPDIITSEGTSNDTSHVGGVPAPEVVGRLGDVETALGVAEADIVAAQNELATIGTSINVLQAVDLATATAQQQLDRDQHVLAEAMLRAVSEANTLRSNFRDAGIIVDPSTGSVRIYALDQVADRVSQAEVRLNGVDATIALTASQMEAYTDAAIATAVLDPSQIADLDTIFVRLTAAEIAIDGVEASVTTKADAVTVTALSGTVTSLSTSLTALTGVVATKAESTTVTALDARVGSVESTVSTLGDVVGVGIDVRQSRYTGQQNGETSLRALLAGDAIGQRALSQLAAIQYELTTKIVDDVSAEAAQRLLLATRMASAEAALTSEQSARVSADAALTVNIGTLTASLATTNASLTSEQIARANADSALSGQITTLGATLSGVSATLSAEQITRADADTALSASIASLSASLGTTNASVSAEAIARADGDSALASSVTTLGSTVGGHSTTLSSYGAVLDGLQGKAGFQFDIDGRITGWELNSGASSGELIFRVDRMRMVHPDTGEDLFVVEGGQAKLRNVEVDTLKVNTAIVPVRFQSSIAVPGGGATGALYEIARCEIVLPVDGYVEAIFNAQQGFASGNQDWNLVLTIDGDSRIVNAGRTNDTPTLVHGKLCSAGTVIVTAGWRAHNSVTLGDRILLAKGFPATA